MRQMNGKRFTICPAEIADEHNHHLDNSFGKYDPEKTLSQLKNERRVLRDSNQSLSSFGSSGEISPYRMVIPAEIQTNGQLSPEKIAVIMVKSEPETTMVIADRTSGIPNVELNNNDNLEDQTENDEENSQRCVQNDHNQYDDEQINEIDDSLNYHHYQKQETSDYNSLSNVQSNSSITTKISNSSDIMVPIPALTYPDTTMKEKTSNGIFNFTSQSQSVDDNNEHEKTIRKPSSGAVLSPVKQRLLTLKGISLAFFSSIFFSLTTVIVKYVNDVHPGEMACFRFLGILLFTLPLLIESRQHPFGPPHLRHWLILRGIAGASSVYFRYCAVHYLPIGDATVIVLSMPVFVCIFAKVFLKEPCGIFHVMALGVTLIGIAFTTKLNVIFGSSEDEVKQAGIDSHNELLGLLCGMGATLVGSSAYIIVRKVKSLHHSVILFNFSWVAITETSIITYTLQGFKLPDCGIAPWLLTILAILSFYGQLMLTKALQAEEAGLVSVTRASSEVIFAFIFQITIFRHMPDLWSIMGALLVTASVLLTSSRKWVITLPKESKVRKALNFVTK